MAVTGLSVDLELKKAFQELQTKMISTHQQLKVIEIQSEQMKRQIQYSKLVQQELSALPENTRTYEGIGKMFLLQPIVTIVEDLEEKSKTLEKKIDLAQGNRTYLEKSLKESEANLRELVTSKQQEQRVL